MQAASFSWPRLLVLLVAMVGSPQLVMAGDEPFAFGDFTWLNGTSRQSDHLIANDKLVVDILLDSRYAFSFHQPIDDTLVGSTTVTRHNELGLLMASVGISAQQGPIAANLSLQFGETATAVSINDVSVNRGQFNLLAAMRYVREASVGFRFPARYGLNLDVGLFMSYIGLCSYLNYENLVYQPSYVSDNTPFFFQGARLQYFPTDRLKFEFWLTNGWQSYAKFNRSPGVGFQALYRPSSSWSLVTNGYAGFDTPNNSRRLRLHSDSSALWRIWQGAASRGVHRAAVSLTFDIGGETGDGIVTLGGAPGRPAQYFVGVMGYGRLWALHDRLGLTLGGGLITNPGRYLVLLPQGPKAAAFDTSPGSAFRAWDASVTFDVMPTKQATLRLEGNFRSSSVPYFAGPGGVTSPSGYEEASLPESWRPDYRRSETRATLAFLLRL